MEANNEQTSRKSHNKNKTEKIKTENICRIIDDLGENIKGKEVLCSAIISGICALLLFFSEDLCMSKICGLLCSFMPNLLGFTIAAYTILFSLNENVCKRLKVVAPDGKIPFEVLHASFVFGLIIQGVSLLLGLLGNVILKCMNHDFAISICWFLLFFSITWVVNMVLYLYSLRTFIVEKN